MEEFIWKHFVKDYENCRDPEVRRRYTRLTGTLGILVNSLLCAGKIVMGILAGSIALMADGLHDMADSLAACITLIGARIAAKPADKKHPYGHARFEYIASLVISAIVLVVGWELLSASIGRCIHPTSTAFSWTMVIFMVAAILLKGSQALFTIDTGKRIGSLPVIAAGTDNRNDVITSIIIVIGMLIHHFTGLELDGYMGCVVSLFILYSGITLIRETISPLLGEPPDKETVEAIQQIVLSHPKVLGMHDLIVYNYGPGRSFASFHAEVDSREKLVEIHDMIDHIEREVHQKLNMVVTCHMDPVEVDNPLRIEAGRKIKGAIREFDEIEGIHDLQVAPGQERIRIIFDVVIAPDRRYDPEAITARLDRAVKEVNPACEAVIEFDRAYL